MAVGDDRERGGSGAEIDAGDAELGFVGRDHGERARIGRGDEARDAEMATLHAQHEVAHGDLVGSHGVEVHREPFAAHAVGFADAAILVEVIADGQRMQNRAPITAGVLAAAGEQALNVVVAHGAGGQGHAGGEAFALETAGRHGNMHVLDHHACHTLCRIDGGANAMLGAVKMGHHARLQALGAGVVEAQHLELHGFALALEPVGHSGGLADQAAHFARADVERGHDALSLTSDCCCVSHPP